VDIPALKGTSVEHRRHVLMSSLRGHIGAHQQIHFTRLEGFQRFQTLVLALVTVQCRGFQASRPMSASRAQPNLHEDKRFMPRVFIFAARRLSSALTL
jgi:hypothetical protein